MASKGEEEGFGTIKMPPYERKLIASQSRSWRCPTCDATNEELLAMVNKPTQGESRESTSTSGDVSQMGTASNTVDAETNNDSRADAESGEPSSHVVPTATAAAVDTPASTSGTSSAIAPSSTLVQRTTTLAAPAVATPTPAASEPARPATPNNAARAPFNPVSVVGLHAARVEACKRTIMAIDSTMGVIFALLVLLLINCIIG